MIQKEALGMGLGLDVEQVPVQRIRKYPRNHILLRFASFSSHHSLSHTQENEHLGYVHDLLKTEHIIYGVGKKAEAADHTPDFITFKITGY